MILYTTIIALSVCLNLCLNGFLGAGWAVSAVWLAAAVGAMVVIDAAVAVCVRCYPEKKIDVFSRYFTVSQRERALYERLGVRRWKDVIPESGKYLCHFAKDKIAEPANNVYILKFLRETCYAEVMHECSFVLSFAALLFLPYRLHIVLPVVLTNALLQLLPAIAQRYNRCRLVKLYRFNARRQMAPAAEEGQNG